MKNCCHGHAEHAAHGNSRGGHVEVPAGTVYTCPMHPEVRQVGPGSCPICGMALEPLMPSGEEEEIAAPGRLLAFFNAGAARAFLVFLAFFTNYNLIPGAPKHDDERVLRTGL